ncbi:hypothetical protein ASD65_12725 [Microbacterium sp. Root61]|uniref:hypothetical protein n=1 Tax=Microbacterium sp. Root61 TaxID=1736570 RepID=UPI0006F87FEE|nr:hypothetical protein [Microbacterium sp. Root61]KRA25189.1 hypothetical protein ASD65_12725 [Microbacterium sp. Root61]
MEWTDEVGYGEWIREGLDDPWRGTMHDMVPRGFPAYIRIFHRPHVAWLPDRPVPSAEEWVRMPERDRQRLSAGMQYAPTTWREAASAFGTTLHASAQWGRIVRTPMDATGWQQTIAPDGRQYDAPPEGNLDGDLVAAAAQHLVAHTSTPDDGFVAVWEGWGGLVGFFGETPSRTFFQIGTGGDTDTDGPDDGARRAAEAAMYDQHNTMLGRSIHDSFNTVLGRPTWQPGILSDEISRGERLRLPGRDYLLFRGGISELTDTDWIRQVPWAGGESGTEGLAPDAESPNLIWPADRAWVMVSEIDYDSTIVGGSSELIRALQADERLETSPVREGTALTWDADEVNR